MADNSQRKKKSNFSQALASVFPQKGDDAPEILRKMVFLISVIVFAVCAYLIFDYFYENYQSRQLYDELDSIYIEAEEETQNPIENPEDDGKPKLLSGAKSLLEINPDTVGYINIPGMSISYPIVQKTSKEEAEYYLHIDFKNQTAKAGALFLDWRDRFNAEEQSDNLIVYGHDMKDGSMFGTLRNYKKDNYVDFYKNHAIIQLNSNYEEAEYKIFGCFLADADTSRSTAPFEYYNYINFSNAENFYEYVNEVKRRTLILNDVDVAYGDKLVTLSTCSQEFTNSRFVVVARKLRENESLEEGTENARENNNPLMPDIWYSFSNERYDPDAEFIPYG